jgi:DHA1 family bicyclomycin/chloramphenicol resistance-like MFS transporter
MAMASHGEKAGTASALMGILQWALASIAALLMGAANNGTALPMAALIGMSGLGALLLYRWLVVPRPILASAP